MKGIWAQDTTTEAWHLIWNRMHADTEHASVPQTMFCGKDLPLDAPEKPGTQLSGFADAVHDVCYRKSEELDDE